MKAGSAIAAHFHGQADACDRLGSPFTARLCRLLADILDDSSRTGNRIIGWPGDPRGDALALRLCGGLHQLVLERLDDRLEAAYPPHDADDAALASAVRSALMDHDTRLESSLDQPPQTNEIGRSGMLLPGFLTIARETGLPLTLCEIGSSAGLNLLFDRFFYAYGDQYWGDQASPVHLAPEMRGTVPPLDGALIVTARRGCDIAPVDITQKDARTRLRSYVWADQQMRHQRLDGALKLAGSVPFSLEKADAADFVAAQLAQRRDGSAFVLFHSIMWQYMPGETKTAITRALAEAGEHATASAPVAHVRMEPLDLGDPYATLSLTLWPDGQTRHLARCDFHGRWIEWIG